MKDALGHGSNAGGLSGGNVTPQAAASAMHSDHVVGGANDSTYHGLHSHAAYAAEGIGDLAHRPGPRVVADKSVKGATHALVRADGSVIGRLYKSGSPAWR